ncbi:hypothetical protein VE01_10190 [Pseudogymnoascus verrucosus]|uniref:Uncharacterized protein n=1 Tax=Pseudogymnoascus verrucosus TaxID=342668 RepID=A0A1B8G7K4_9PEZI|nr:uncharacterized protein VE01_10190 [Pseudogymnoascus verrucosus]OBT91818.1 hypothetical protein VE01_10190 [Pseudogymnoascus verrucosus]
MDPQTIELVESMIGIFDAISSDLSSVQTIVSADKLETDGHYLLQLDEKLIITKWQALAAEC